MAKGSNAKYFSDSPCRTIVPRTNPHPSQGQTGQSGDATVEFNRNGRFVPGTGPGLSQGRFRFVPDTAPPKMFISLVFFLADKVITNSIPDRLRGVIVKKRLLQKSEGRFSEQSPGWIFRGIFCWIFSGLFPWKNRRKISTQNIHGKIHWPWEA